MQPMRVGVVGAGAISDIYLQNMIQKFEGLTVVGVGSRHMENARVKAEKYSIAAMTLEEMLADPSIEMLVNLTPAVAHYDIVKRGLEAGKHVYTEKVVTPTGAPARELAALADEKGLYLGAAPDTFLGSAIQTAGKAIADDVIGDVTGFAAVLNRDKGLTYERAEFTTQPGGGMGYDVGIYYLTALLSLLGPAAEVCGMVQTNRPVRTYQMPGHPKFGQSYEIQNENLMAAAVRLRSGALGTLQFNGDAIFPEKPHLVIQGMKGVLFLPDPNTFGGEVRLTKALEMDGREHVLPPVNPYSGNERGLGPAEMAAAIRAGRPSRASKEMACHALELLDGVVQSSGTRAFVSLESSFERPAPFWGDDALQA